MPQTNRIVYAAAALCALLGMSSPLDLSSPRRDGADGRQQEPFIFNELCALKEDAGPCKAIKQRFFFDVELGRCRAFEFGGCGGNDNNFHTLEQCQDMCVVSDDKDPCPLAEAPGPCRGLVTRYFFDSMTQQCRRFFYGGCFGNANNFRSLAACQARCHHPAEAVKPPEVAPPTIATGELVVSERLVQSNQSKILTKEFVPWEACFSPAHGGDEMCKGKERRFAFNASTKRCQMFSYSGCGGNGNNFRLRRHCIHKCIKNKTGHGRGMRIRIKKKNLESILRISA